MTENHSEQIGLLMPLNAALPVFPPECSGDVCIGANTAELDMEIPIPIALA